MAIARDEDKLAEEEPAAVSSTTQDLVVVRRLRISCGFPRCLDSFERIFAGMGPS
jgi:hypothetical protein